MSAGNLPARVGLQLPAWVERGIDRERAYSSDADKVALAIALAGRNVEEATGGPFGAALFGPDDRVVAAGVNVVLPQSTSLAHAENMAYMLAQQALGRPRINLDDQGRPCGPYTLATSAQPCCQCYGATVWAGIDRLLIGASADDVHELTEFDEGPLPADWPGELARRGIEVVRDIARDQAREVFVAYARAGGRRY
ncbi:nucleoside deaminase [Luteimonas arsenica]|uniref:nucleoside deaminase n=1 Tax=Luteimonas arsenica TaxID=1586242 RepID=UPI001054CB74|nr:nucleoside deaminase [Luteimonas arsenica]